MIITFIAILLICVTFNPITFTYAQSLYGRIEVAGQSLYKTNNFTSNYKDIVCELENTYFVQILYEDYISYKVNYNGTTGYVNKNHIKRISGEPQNPFPNNIKLTTNKTCYLRSTPSQSDYGNNIMLISANTQVDYIGKIKATSIEDFGDNTWYYVEYNDIFGYIFSGYFKSKPTIYPNTEQISFIDEVSIINPLSDSKIAIIVCILATPFGFTMLMCYHPQKHGHKLKVKNKN